MVTSTSSSSGPAGAARPKCAGWSGSVGQNPANGPDDNWSRVRDQRLKGQTGRLVLMGRWPGRSGRGPTSAGLPGSCGNSRRFGLGGVRAGVIGAVGVVGVQV